MNGQGRILQPIRSHPSTESSPSEVSSNSWTQIPLQLNRPRQHATSLQLLLYPHEPFAIHVRPYHQEATSPSRKLQFERFHVQNFGRHSSANIPEGPVSARRVARLSIHNTGQHQQDGIASGTPAPSTCTSTKSPDSISAIGPDVAVGADTALDADGKRSARIVRKRARHLNALSFGTNTYHHTRVAGNCPQ